MLVLMLGVNLREPFVINLSFKMEIMENDINLFRAASSVKHENRTE